MGIVIKISRTNNVDETRKALDMLASQRKKRSKKLSDFYGKLKGFYGDGLEYQKKLRK
jgi:hypothetical protein